MAHVIVLSLVFDRVQNGQDADFICVLHAQEATLDTFGSRGLLCNHWI